MIGLVILGFAWIAVLAMPEIYVQISALVNRRNERLTLERIADWYEREKFAKALTE